MDEDELIKIIRNTAFANQTYLGTMMATGFMEAKQRLIDLYKYKSAADKQQAIREKMIKVLESEGDTSIITGIIFGILREMVIDEPALLLKELYKKYLPEREFQFIQSVFNSPLWHEGVTEAAAEEELRSLTKQARGLFEDYKKMGRDDTKPTKQNFDDTTSTKHNLTKKHYSSTMYLLVHRYIAFFIQQEDRRKIKHDYLPDLKLLNAGQIRLRLKEIFKNSEMVDKQSEVGNANSAGQFNPGYLKHVNDLLTFYGIHWHEYGHNNVDAQAPWLRTLMSKYTEKDSHFDDLSAIHETGGDIEAALIGFMERNREEDVFYQNMLSLHEGLGNGAMNEVFQELKKRMEGMFQGPELTPEELYDEYIKNWKFREGHTMARGFLCWLVSQKAPLGGILRDEKDWVLLFVSYNEVLDEIGKTGPQPAWEEYFLKGLKTGSLRNIKIKEAAGLILSGAANKRTRWLTVMQFYLSFI